LAIQDDLFECAIKAKERAYAPFSRFKVGAAILTKSGKLYSGCNIETSSYSLTICAERLAVFKAISEGEKSFRAVAISTSSDDFCPPCGACRQVLWDLARDIDVFLVQDRKTYQKFRLADLFPKAFDQGYLIHDKGKQTG